MVISLLQGIKKKKKSGYMGSEFSTHFPGVGSLIFFLGTGKLLLPLHFQRPLCQQAVTSQPRALSSFTFPARTVLLPGQKITESSTLGPLKPPQSPPARLCRVHPRLPVSQRGARTLTFPGENGAAQRQQQNGHLDSQRHKDEDHEGGAAGGSEAVEVDGPLGPAVAVDGSAGVFPVVGEGPQLPGDAVAGAAARAQVAAEGPGPGEGGRGLPLGRAPGLEGVGAAGAHRDVDDPGGGCGGMATGEGQRVRVVTNAWNEVLVLVEPQRGSVKVELDTEG